MNTYIALLRGIGGKNTLPMKGLVELLGGMALSKVRTYIQSGNAIFQSGRMGASGFSVRIKDAIDHRYGLLLFARIEKSLGVSGTARNWRSVSKIKAIAERIL